MVSIPFRQRYIIALMVLFLGFLGVGHKVRAEEQSEYSFLPVPVEGIDKAGQVTFPSPKEEQIYEKFEPTETVPPIVNIVQDKPVLSAKAITVDIVSDELKFDEDNNIFTAIGSARVDIPSENATLEADTILYDQSKELLTGKGNVKITKNKDVIHGNFVNISLTQESVLIDSPSSQVDKIVIKAKKGEIVTNSLDLFDGQAVIDDENFNIQVSSNLYRPKDLENSIFLESLKLKAKDKPASPRYKIQAGEIELDKTKEYNNLTIKDAKVYIGKVKVASISKLRMTVGDLNQPIRMIMPNLPEVGFERQLGGAYLGPHLALDLPFNSRLKVSPVGTLGGDRNFLGYGGILRFDSFSNSTIFGYSSGEGKPYLKGYQELFNESTKFKYSINDYIDNGFLGEGVERPQYIMELVDERELGKVLNHNIKTRASTAVARDGINSVGTFRMQLQTDILSDHPLFSLGKVADFRLQGQFNLSAYGTGDALTVLRGGPRIDWNLGRLALTTAYFQAGVWGKTPFTFDNYTRGTSNVVLGGDLKVSDYLSVGGVQNLNLLQDGGDDRFSSENQVYARIGPDDFKIRAGYDFVRKRPLVGVDLLIGSGRSGIGFNKLKVKQSQP